MTRVPEQRFGPYEIGESIGAGGMGEVYRAFDTNLERSVAIKVLRDGLASDPERVARLEREARMLAALNHPNIAQIYGLEKSQSSRALAMELVEGTTLAARIARGPLPVTNALDIAAQIAAALEAAHELGIVHRDLKPSNVMLRPDGIVKVLDFGIAKTLEPEAPAEAGSRAMTQAGVVLGTTGYMSPEQARDRRVDRRTDIWAFGCVLYEMLTGQPAFGGEDDTVTLARVLEREPDLGALPAGVPPAVRQTLKLCLQKDPSRRARDIGDVRLALGGAFDSGARSSAPSAVGRVRALAVAVAVAAVTLLGVWLWTASLELPRAERPLMRLRTAAGVADSLGPTMAISPDGTEIVYRVIGAGDVPQLAVRSLSESGETPLPGTEGGYNPFFSPDGQWIAYMAGGRLMKIPVGGGVPVALAEAAIGRFGSWGPDGHIYAELNPFSGIFRVADQGGSVERLTRPRRDRHAWPQILPNGQLLYTAALAGLLENGRIEVMSLETGETTVVLEGGYMARYVASGEASGHILYVRRGVLYAVPFDLERLEVVGERVQLVDDLATTGAQLNNAYDVSATGILVYSNGRPAQRWPIVWVDEASAVQPLVETPLAYYTPRISHDGRRLVYAVENERGQDIYVYDVERDLTTRLTFDSAANLWPVWAPDSEHIAFTSLTEQGAALWWVRADGTGGPQRLLERDNPMRQIMLSPDGATLAFTEQDPETGSDLWILPLDLSDPTIPVPQEPRPLIKTPNNEGVPAFSPDGRWISYLSDELGPYEVWVQPFPELGGRWQISSGGGGYSFWSKTEDVLLFQAFGRIMRVAYTIEGDRFVPGAPRPWMSVPTIPAPVGFEALDLAPDGRRFAALPNVNETPSGPGSVTFLLNVFDELRRRAPAVP